MYDQCLQADQLKRFAPLSLLTHSFILSLYVKVCIRFIVFPQISRCFFICQELCWTKDLCISFTSSCFCFQSEGGSKNFSMGWGGGGVRLKDFRTGEGLPIWGWGSFCFGVSTPLHAMGKIYCSGAVKIVLENTWNNSLTDEVESPCHWQMNLAIL